MSSNDTVAIGKGSNENRRDLDRVALDKGIRPVEIAADNDMPPGILSMKPLATMPDAARQMGPNTNGNPGTMPTPLASPISPNLKSELGKLNPDKAQRVRDLVSRKTSA